MRSCASRSRVGGQSLIEYLLASVLIALALVPLIDAGDGMLLTAIRHYHAGFTFRLSLP